LGIRLDGDRTKKRLLDILKDLADLPNDFDTQMQDLNEDQKSVFDFVASSVNNPIMTADRQNVIVMQGGAGVGKTHVVRTIGWYLRKQAKCVLHVSATALSASLYYAGMTAHLAFGIPVQDKYDQGEIRCEIKRAIEEKLEVLKGVELITWDEVFTMNRKLIEAVSDYMKKIRGNNLPFGGVTTILLGDPRQLSPIISESRNTRSALEASFITSPLNKNGKQFKLTVQMRISSHPHFSNWVQRIGTGTIGTVVSPTERNIPLPFSEIRTMKVKENTLAQFFDTIFPNLGSMEPHAVARRAILSPLREPVARYHAIAMSRLPGQTRLCLSMTRQKNREDNMVDPARNHRMDMTDDFMNELQYSGVPDHRLLVKKGAVFILCRNQAPYTNGTKVVITEIRSKFLLEARVIDPINFTLSVEPFFIHRIMFEWEMPSLHIKMQRMQFPLVSSYAITVNRSQGLTLSFVGLDLRDQVFSHGHSFVAWSRAESPSNICLYVNENQHFFNNIVFQELVK
jgi:hypothetical protein